MKQNFRRAKYLNQTGSRVGCYYFNRTEYFDFHRYPLLFRHKLYAVLAIVFSAYLLRCWFEFEMGAFWGSVIFLTALYLASVGVTCFTILQQRYARFSGYLLVPDKFLKFWRSLEIEHEIYDYDTVATFSHHKTDLHFLDTYTKKQSGYFSQTDAQTPTTDEVPYSE